MKSFFLSHHIDDKQKNSKDSLGITIFKPEYLQDELDKFIKYCNKNGLDILKEQEIILSKDAVIALYKNIFSFSKDDLLFGIKWKEDTIDYLTSGSSICFLVKGEDVDSKLLKYKYELRDNYGKITHPKFILNAEDFKQKVIKNIIHVVDEDELQNGLWLLFYR